MPTGTVVSRGYLAPRAVEAVRGRVRTMFDRCAYVTVDGGPALVLHATGGDHTPTSLCLASWPPAAAAIVVGDAVVGRAGHLKVGELVLDVRAARTWHPGPPPASTACVADPGASHRLALRAAARRTGELVPGLELALVERDADRVTVCVGSLIGRGPGLTPSGDDAIVGLLAVLHRLGGAGNGSRVLLGRAVAARLHRTGDISAHYLRLAIAGHVGERLVALCDALAGDARDEVERAAAAVVYTGATSGADALLGIVAGLRVLAAGRERSVAA